VFADGGPADWEFAREFSHGQRAVAQTLEDAAAHGIAKGVQRDVDS
jgi:hypothetical protein